MSATSSDDQWSLIELHRSADGIVRLVAQAGRHGRARRATATCRGHVSGVWLDDLCGQVLRRHLEAASRLRGLREQWLSAARRHEVCGRRVRATRLRERAFLLGAALHELSALANATSEPPAGVP